MGGTGVRSIALHEGDFTRLKAILGRTQRELGADLILLMDRSGQQIASEGPCADIDQTALASLAAANIAATNGLAKLVEEPCFSTLYHQGSRRSILISDVSRSLALVLVFRPSLAPGLVRWKIRLAAASLDGVLADFLNRMDPAAQPPVKGSEPANTRFFTDEELDRLFDQLGPKPEADRKVQL